MLKRTCPIEEEVEAFIINNQSQIIAVNQPGCRGYVQIGYLEDVLKFIVIFVPLKILLSPEHQEVIATNRNFVQHLLRKVRMYDPETQIVVGYQGQDLETYSVVISFEED